jgi:hypothetical protein
VVGADDEIFPFTLEQLADLVDGQPLPLSQVLSQIANIVETALAGARHFIQLFGVEQACLAKLLHQTGDRRKTHKLALD